MILSILLQEFCFQSEHLRGVSPATLKRYRENIQFFCLQTKISKVDELSSEKVSDFFLHGRSVRNWKPATYQTYYQSLNRFFKWCVKKGYIESNPIKGIEVPKIEKGLPKHLTKQEADRLLEVVYNYPYTNEFIQYRNHAVFSTFLFTGLRKKELLRLTLKDVDMDNLVLTVRGGKGNKDRVLPISFKLARSLYKYLVVRKKHKKTCPEFFTSSTLNLGFTNSGLKRWIKVYQEISRIHFTAHILRHTFATLMLESGCDIYSLSKMLGHSEITTTTIYLSSSVEHLRGMIDNHPLS